MSIVAFLESDHIILSPIDTNNINLYHEFINIQQNDIFTEHAEFPHSLDSLVNYINLKTNTSRSILLGMYLRDTLTHIGNIELDNINLIHGTAEYKILLDYRSTKRGFAYEASKLLMNHAFNKLNLHKITLGVNVENLSAIKLYKKLGFSEEALLKEELLKGGRRIDLIRMSCFNKVLK